MEQIVKKTRERKNLKLRNLLTLIFKLFGMLEVALKFCYGKTSR